MLQCIESLCGCSLQFWETPPRVVCWFEKYHFVFIFRHTALWQCSPVFSWFWQSQRSITVFQWKEWVFSCGAFLSTYRDCSTNTSDCAAWPWARAGLCCADRAWGRLDKAKQQPSCSLGDQISLAAVWHWMAVGTGSKGRRGITAIKNRELCLCDRIKILHWKYRLLVIKMHIIYCNIYIHIYSLLSTFGGKKGPQNTTKDKNKKYRLFVTVKLQIILSIFVFSGC